MMMIPCDGNAMRTAPFCLLKKLSFSHIAAFIFSFCSVVCRPPQNAGKYMLLPHSIELSQETMHVKTPQHPTAVVFLNAGQVVRSLTGRKQKAVEILFWGCFMVFFPALFVSGHWSSRII